MIEEEITKEDFVPGTKECPKEWGIRDQKSGEWMGSSTAPLTYGKRTCAQICAQVLAEQMKLPMGRFMAERFTGANVLVKTEKTKRSPEEALARVMGEDI